jgi:hypothetical protein
MPSKIKDLHTKEIDLNKIIPFPKKVYKDAEWLGEKLKQDAHEIRCVLGVVFFKDGEISLASTKLNVDDLVLGTKFLDVFASECIATHLRGDDE